jgi:hypothetical protein
MQKEIRQQINYQTDETGLSRPFRKLAFSLTSTIVPAVLHRLAAHHPYNSQAFSWSKHLAQMPQPYKSKMIREEHFLVIIVCSDKRTT